MRRTIAAALMVCLVVSSCGPFGEDAGPTPAPSPRELAGASCEDQEDGSFDNVPDFVRVDVESDEGVDRLRFRFRLSDPDATEAPRFFISYVDEVLTEGEGAPVELEGEAFVAVSFHAVGVDLAGEEAIEVYTGPKEIAPRLPTVRELKHTGDFEGVVSWGIGLARRACLVARATARELTLEFPSP